MRWIVYINHPFRAALRFGPGSCVAITGTDSPTIFDSLEDAADRCRSVTPNNLAGVEEYPDAIPDDPPTTVDPGSTAPTVSDPTGSQTPSLPAGNPGSSDSQ